MKSTILTSVIGLILLALFLTQFFLKLEWSWLWSLQQEELYKRWTGLFLALFIAFQWVLSLSRVLKRLRPYSLKMTTLHKWVGALSPLFFYVHSIGMGYGYLALLAYVFLANTLLGYVNLDVIKNDSELLFKGWMMTHVALSMIVTILLFFHIGTVFYYK